MQIGEVARRSGVSARMLRHYDALGIVSPSDRSSSGYREYSDDDIRRIFHVESLRSLGLSLKEIGRAMDDPGFAPAQLVADLIAATRERIRIQQELLDRLHNVAATGPGDWEQVLGALTLLAELGAANPGTRQRAALAADGEHVSADALAQALLREENPNVAGALHWALARSDAPAPSLLITALDSPDPDARLRAVRALAELPDDAALRAALERPDAGVRTVAALELGGRGDRAAIAELVDMVLRGDRDVQAAEALAVVATDGADAAIVDALRVGAAPAAEYPVRQRVVQALAELPGDAAAAALAALRDDPDPRIARTAAYLTDR